MKISIYELREIVRKELSGEFPTTRENRETIEPVMDEPILSLDENFTFDDSFETVNEQTFLHETEQKIGEIKSISEEIRRMKQLVDFRSPLLFKDNS